MWRKQPDVRSSVSEAPGAPDSPANPNQRASQPYASPMSSSSTSQPPRVDAAVLTRGIRIKGELTGKADLTIDGEVDGSIRLTESRLTVGQAGHIRADIEAAEIVVKGHVEGDLRGRDRVVLGSSCHVVGDLESPRVAIEEGARFNGRVEMGPGADAREHQAKRAPQITAAPARPSSMPEVTPVPVTVGGNRNS